MSEEMLDEAFFALSDPTRRAILSRLKDGPLNVNELAEPFSMTLPAISKHIKVLEKAGLVKRSRERQSRPVSLEIAPLKAVETYLWGYRKLWDSRIDKLDSYLKLLSDKEKT